MLIAGFHGVGKTSACYLDSMSQSFELAIADCMTIAEHKLVTAIELSSVNEYLFDVI